MRIYFNTEKFNKAEKIIKGSKDLVEVKHDLIRIDHARAGINNGDRTTAIKLNQELRIKYPCIDRMLKIADTFPIYSQKTTNTPTIDSTEDIDIVRLQQDRCGIICDIAIKKGIATNIEDLINHKN